MKPLIEKPSYWAINKIFIQGVASKRLMIVFKTPPCQKMLTKGRCFICGFDTHSLGVKNPHYRLVSQFRFLQDLIKKKGVDHIDILGSGSILDSEQIDYQQVLELIKEIRKIKNLKSVLIEGRVEFCQIDKIKEIKKILNNIQLEYGIGLECWSNYVRNTILKKNLKLKDYINCLIKLTKIDVGLCTYLLIGIPKLSLEDSLKETKNSILKVINLYKKYHCQGRIALFPIFIAPNTPLECLYNQGKYKLISLTDIIDILLEIKKKVDLKKYPIFIGLDDENLSKKIFLKPANLEEKKALKIIHKFNYSQEI